MSEKRHNSAEPYRTQRNASALVIAFWVIAALIIFVTSFVAFLVAPLVLTVLFGGGLYLQEKLGERRQQHAPPAPVTAAEQLEVGARAVPAGGYARYGDLPNTGDQG